MNVFSSGRYCLPRKAALPPILLGGVVLTWILLAGVVARADLISTPLCAEVHGFAGEFNDHLSIPVEKSPGPGEAIVLTVRVFPFAMDHLLSEWVYLNATYYLPEGALVSRISDNHGLLELRNVAENTDIEVRITRVVLDSPAPFRFFSYFANRPLCRIAVTPHNSFMSSVPHKLLGSSQPVTMYFKTELPPNFNALSINVLEENSDSSAFRALDKQGVERSYISGDLVPVGSGNTVAFSFTPAANESVSPYCFTAISVTYGEWQGEDAERPTRNPTSRGGGTAVPTPSTPRRASPPSSPSMSILRRLLWIAVLLFLLYQVAFALYNYRVLGKRDVIDIVPCAEAVTAGVRAVQLATTGGLGAIQRRKEGYDAMPTMDDPYA